MQPTPESMRESEFVLQNPFVNSEREIGYLTTDIGKLANMHVVLLGIPGAGKTTLANELRQLDPAINYISLGEISRNLDPASSHKKELDRLFALGKPVGLPELFLDIIEPHIDRALTDGRGYILDGIPKKEEEIDPLLQFLNEKGADLEMVVSCEAPPMVAHGRIIERSARQGEEDTMEIFLNRTKIYLRDLDLFKSRLTKDGEIPLYIVDTDKHLAGPSARALIYLAGVESAGIKDPENSGISEQLLLHNSIRTGDRESALRIIGPKFDDTFTNLDYAAVCDPEITPEDRQAQIEGAYLLLDAKLQDTPLFLKRLAKNYTDTTLASIEHIYDSLVEEVVLRKGSDFSQDDVMDIFSQQLNLKERIKALQHEVMAGQSLNSLTSREIEINQEELTHIESVLKRRAVANGIDESDVNIHDLMSLQPRLWGQLTSNQILFAPDYNYRSSANSIPESHHSLLPFTHNERRMSANSMGEYIPFVEAVSATENTYSSTFGFIHFVGMDKTGEAYGVEYPIMMYDRRLLDLGSDTINDVLILTDEFYGNHDLWHNLVPVYSKSFILHHPDAPLSHGGRLDVYNSFGEGLRAEKEEYEIGVAMSHARTQLERFKLDESVRTQQESLILTALDRLAGLPTELSGECSSEEIENIVDYLACRAATKAYNVFPDGDPIYTPIKEKLLALGVKPMQISAHDVADLFYRQGLIRTATVNETLPDETFPAEADKLLAIKNSFEIANKLIRDGVDITSAKRESGAEHIVERLDAWGVINKLSEAPVVELDVLQKSRWLAIVGPQRQQLRGHMEKVHGKPGYLFNGQTLTEPRDLVLLQKKAIDKDMGEYEYRAEVRSENQRLSYEIYSLVFDDDQELHRESRTALNSLRESDDIGQRLFAREAVAKLDMVMDELVSNTYRPIDEQIEYLESFSDALGAAEADTLQAICAQVVRMIIGRYRILGARERDHQRVRGVDYASAAQTLADENMTIV